MNKTTDQIKRDIRSRNRMGVEEAIGLVRMASTITKEPSDTHLFTARITTDSLDRDNEVVMPNGVDTRSFDRSGAVFWNHDYDKPVASRVGISKNDSFIEAKARFMKRPDDYQGEFFPDFVRAFVNQVPHVGVSVGFRPLLGRSPTAKDIEVFGKDVGYIHTHIELLEYSIAPVQSNPGALVTSVGKSCIKALFPEATIADAQEQKPKKKVYIIIPRYIPKPKRRRVDISEMVDKSVARSMAAMRGVL